MRLQACLWGMLAIGGLTVSDAQERQITFTPKNHNLDNNDNFSPDGRFLCYDTREMIGPGIENSQSVEKVEIATGRETVLYEAIDSIVGAKAAPGIGAASFSFVDDVVAFIHGPPLEEVAARGHYGKPNRGGGSVSGDGSRKLRWLDARDVSKGETTPGAHRGGTHRHEFSRDGKRIGFTYDDFLLPEYDRTIGYLEERAGAPEGASHYFALLVPVTRKGESKPGELEKAYGDSWITPDGSLRGFIGKVRNAGGETYEESLFTVRVPVSVDITTADSGSATRFPAPPEGVSVERITNGWAGGIVRGSPSGDRIAYYAKADDGSTQIFVVAADGLEGHADADRRPRQVTHLTEGAGPGLRWHVSGKYVACISRNAVVVTSIATGDSAALTLLDDVDERLNLVWSHDGRLLAYNKAIAHESGLKNYDRSDFLQIFVLDFKAF